MTKKEYQRGKEQTRQEAIDWQRESSNTARSYGEIADATAYFEAKAKRYGLVREFKENGVL